jgi:hypothetical protein
MKVFLIGLAIVIVVVMGLLGYWGLFAKISISEKDLPAMTLVYEKYVGPYMETGKIIMKLSKDLAGDNIVTKRAFGIYYDNPGKVAQDKLRSVAGSILEENDAQKASGLTRYNVKEFPATKAIVAEHPYVSKMSIILGIMKVYPKLAKYMQTKGYGMQSQIIEIYDLPNKKIEYVVALNVDQKVFGSFLEAGEEKHQ